MASSVDRSFCLARCSDRGVCFASAEEHFCVCYDVDMDPSDCSPLSTSTTIPDSSEGFWISWLLLCLVGTALLGAFWAVGWLMVRSVDRSFCPSRCSDSGVCFLRDREFLCVCYEVEVDPTDCAPITTTTISSGVDDADWHSLWPVLVALVIACAVVCGLNFVMCWFVRCYRRTRETNIVECEDGGKREGREDMLEAIPLDSECDDN
ncbi:hypothetical protein ANCCAN_12853 [Ancylostoma caninum]|uniref:Uncharacterized protein n=1 Tax=Ancylostoma caninum TaxID=29170 RepID=A0A368GDX9_ANCCA|nr:hypothetical protein ANCCAN_12853 [Ancylostoma caninum]